NVEQDLEHHDRCARSPRLERMTMLAAKCWLYLSMLATGAEPASLDAALSPLAKAHHGKAAIAIKHLGTGEEYRLHDDEVMSTASLIKFPVMVETYFQFAESKVRKNDLIILEKSDMVPGSGILTDHFTPGASFTLRDAVRMMIVFSDNTATNLVLDH